MRMQPKQESIKNFAMVPVIELLEPRLLLSQAGVLYTLQGMATGTSVTTIPDAFGSGVSLDEHAGCIDIGGYTTHFRCFDCRPGLFGSRSRPRRSPILWINALSALS